MKYPLLILSLLIGLNGLTQTYTESSVSMGVNHIHVDEHLIGGGTVVFDYNSDGFPDIFFTGGTVQDHLFENDQNGSFIDVSVASGISSISSIKTVGAISGDIDNDGDRDLFITTSKDYGNILLENNGDGTFSDISIQADISDTMWSSSASFGDFNLDGYLDIYVANYTNFNNTPFFLNLAGGIRNKLYLNNGDNTFTDISISSATNNIGTGLATAFTDYDQDNDVDILIGNDFGYTFGANALLKNNYPMANFSDVSVALNMDAAIDAMGIAIGDFDEDLDFDYYISNMMENRLHRFENGVYADVAPSANVEFDSVVSWGTFFFDYDNDADLDLFCASGGIMTSAVAQTNGLFANQGNGNFLNSTQAENVGTIKRTRGAAYGDFNLDGHLDFVTANVGIDNLDADNPSVFMNNATSGNHWIGINLTGSTVNHDAFGTHIKLSAGGRTWIREVDGGSSYLSQNSSAVHFGLENFSTIDTIEITWPGGDEQILLNVSADQYIDITQNTNSLDETNPKINVSVFPNPTSQKINILTDANETIKTISITDLLGRKTAFISKNGLLNQIDVSSLPEGSYTLKLELETTTLMRTIQIIH
ncbi:MAG: FG-GAP-like repeat-containing protein [Crocinitomicaceae bacterium]|nr:FG-GAP-like repeat-containing protein [Crocinitomicaceae bacterium]